LWLTDKTSFGKIVALDRGDRTIDVKKGASRADVHPSAVCAFTHVSTDAMADALTRIGESVANSGAEYGAALALLRGDPPRLGQGTFGGASGESAQDKAMRLVGSLDRTVLPIQGPPGAGKTFLGARMICALVQAGKRVGIVATTHEVIQYLLRAVVKEAALTRLPIAVAHKWDDGQAPAPGILSIDDNAEARRAIVSGEVRVLGGTAWMWSREEFAGSVDVLFVDEAGQMSLANVVAVSQAANSVVLLGDPQQLEQPRKGSHPEGVEVSALEHLLVGRQTISPDRGIFLPVTWRLAPRICSFTSEAFYDDRLRPRDGLERQRVLGADGFPEAGLALVSVAHDGNRNHSPEEVDAVASLVGRLTAGGVTWIDGDGTAAPVTGANILVVAPYNAQVTRLIERLEATGVRAGTVDKFQGKEAAVVIYSMATSSPDEAPRGLEFLFSRNRLNVATSRARCVAIVVASPRLLDVECRTPRQMRLANALCRYRELSTPLTVV
jgi:uncharacterized protein